MHREPLPPSLRVAETVQSPHLSPGQDQALSDFKGSAATVAAHYRGSQPATSIPLQLTAVW